ncbi:MAG TPA: TonB-dependent receptor, partial [Pseudomonadales bacterium]|nr:TonB-dependent receptor [Pseudomonadales bacterium]
VEAGTVRLAQQVEQFEAGSGGASSVTVNAGSSEAKGVELELTAAPVDDLLLTLNYGYVDTEYNRFVTSVMNPVTGFPKMDESYEPVIADVSAFASTIFGSPKHQAALIMQYSFPSTSIGTFVAQVDTTYASARNFHSQLNRYDRSGRHTVWNARLTLRDIPVPRGDLSLALWGRNLGNEEVREWGIDFGALGYATNTYRELRSVGADLRYVY